MLGSGGSLVVVIAVSGCEGLLYWREAERVIEDFGLHAP